MTETEWPRFQPCRATNCRASLGAYPEGIRRTFTGANHPERMERVEEMARRPQ